MATETEATWWGTVALPVFAVVAVLVAGLAVVAFGLRPSPDPPQTLAAVLDDRKIKKRKKEHTHKDKKQSNGQVTQDSETKAKKVAEPKKSPTKEKVKEQIEKKQEKPVEQKPVEKKTPKKENVKKQKESVVKPADYDEGEWEKVPSRNDKKKGKKEEEKKESPVKEKKKKDVKKETSKETNEDEKKVSPKKVAAPPLPKDLQDKVNELQRVLNEVEKRDRSQTPVKSENLSEGSAPTTPTVKDTKKNKNTAENVDVLPQRAQKNAKKQASVETEEPVVVETTNSGQNAAVFDELGDTWTDAKVPKKGKKKARKDQ